MIFNPGGKNFTTYLTLYWTSQRSAKTCQKRYSQTIMLNFTFASRTSLWRIFFSFRPYFTILLSISQWCRVIHIAGSILMAFSSILNDMMKLCIYFRKCTAKLRLWLYYETLTLRYSGFDFLDHTARLIRTYLETVHLDVPGSWLEIILYDVEFLKIIIYSLIKVIKIHKIMQHKAATYIFTSISKK